MGSPLPEKAGGERRWLGRDVRSQVLDAHHVCARETCLLELTRACVKRPQTSPRHNIRSAFLLRLVYSGVLVLLLADVPREHLGEGGVCVCAHVCVSVGRRKLPCSSSRRSCTQPWACLPFASLR